MGLCCAAWVGRRIIGMGYELCPDDMAHERGFQRMHSTPRWLQRLYPELCPDEMAHEGDFRGCPVLLTWLQRYVP